MKRHFIKCGTTCQAVMYIDIVVIIWSNDTKHFFFNWNYFIILFGTIACMDIKGAATESLVNFQCTQELAIKIWVIQILGNECIKLKRLELKQVNWCLIISISKFLSRTHHGSLQNKMVLCCLLNQRARCKNAFIIYWYRAEQSIAFFSIEKINCLSIAKLAWYSNSKKCMRCMQKA